MIESFAVTLAQLTSRPVQLAPVMGWAKVPDVIGNGERVTLSWDGSQDGPARRRRSLPTRSRPSARSRS